MCKNISLLILLTAFISSSLDAMPTPYAPFKVGTERNSSDIGLYTYDEAGNRISNGLSGDKSQAVRMGLLTKPVAIRTGNGSNPEFFYYDSNGSRYLRVHEDGRKTLYLSGMRYILPTQGSGKQPQSVVSIHAKGYSPDVQVNIPQDTSLEKSYTYFIKDHLGSPVRSVGSLDRSVRFDIVGQRVSAMGVHSENEVDEQVEQTPGFTGHESIASATSTHMNGRILDNRTGLVLGPDIFILDAGQLSALNRYSYMDNSFVNGTDESGWVENNEFRVLDESSKAPLRTYIYTNMHIADRSLYRGYAIEEGDRKIFKFRRAATTLPGHAHLYLESNKWTFADFAKAFRSQELSGKGIFGSDVGGGYVETEFFAHINPINSFKSGGRLTTYAVDTLNLGDLRGKSSFHTMNPKVDGSRAYLGDSTGYFMPQEHIRDFLEQIHRITGKPLKIEEHAISDLFPWNGQIDPNFYTKDFNKVKEFIQPIVHDINTSYYNSLSRRTHNNLHSLSESARAKGGFFSSRCCSFLR